MTTLNIPNKLDKEVKAVCDCGLESKVTTFRRLKNKWIFCKCKKPMKVKKDETTPPISTPY